MGEVALSRDTISHYSRVLTAPLSINRAHAPPSSFFLERRREESDRIRRIEHRRSAMMQILSLELRQVGRLAADGDERADNEVQDSSDRELVN